MKKVSVLLSLAILLGATVAVNASIPEMYTDHIASVGVVTRVYFYLRHCDDSTGACAWGYFGTDPDDRPPTTGDPVNEYAYVQFPTAFDDLGDEAMTTMQDLAIQAGRAREELQDAGITAIYTDSYMDAGVSRTFEYHLLTHAGTWYYFGSDPAEHPPTGEGDVIEVAAVQFPRDFDELGEAENSALYEIALQAGLAREGLE